MTENLDQADTKGRRGTGSLADMVAVSPEAPFAQSFPRVTILKVAVLAGLLVAINFDEFPRLLAQWIDDPNWSHGFLIPLFSLYLLYSRREELLAAERRVCLWGLPILLFGASLQVVAHWVRNPWSFQIGMVVLLFGLVLYLAGAKMTRLTWLPIFFLIFALPIPRIYYSRVALPLQNFAARGSATLLQFFGARITISASNLGIHSLGGNYYPLTVEEACSGMRLLMAFLALSVAMAYLADRPIWQRVVLVAMGVPVAILCNILRVTITCTAFLRDDPEWGQGFMHEFTGMLMLAPAFVILWLIGWVLRNLYVEAEVDEEKGSSGLDATAKEATP